MKVEPEAHGTNPQIPGETDPVRDVQVYASREAVEVVVEADDDIDLELWGLRRKRDLFERVFDCRLEVVDAQLELSLDQDDRVAGALPRRA